MNKKIIIDGQETNYSVSDMGQVFNDKKNIELQGTITKEGYRRVQLSLFNGKLKTYLVHRLVAQAFCENPNNYEIIDHINRHKDDNRAENLRWASFSENSLNVERNEKNKIKNINNSIFDFENSIPIKQDNNYLIDTKGQVFNLKMNSIVKGSERRGYKRISLKGKYYSVHRLVYESFVGEIPKNAVIDHIDGNRSNNVLTNLRCVSQSKNMDNAYKNGHKSAVKIKQYTLDGEYLKTYNSIREAAEQTNGLEAAIREASLRHGTSNNFYWIREDDTTPIEKVLQEWIPEGYVLITECPSYCINKDGKVYNKYTNKIQKEKYRSNGEPYVVLQSKRVNISVLLKKYIIEP